MSELCPSCGGELALRFCPRCGEKRLEQEDLSARATLAQLVEAFSSLDGKLLATLKTLVLPGFLTRELLRGARVRYLKPIQLFALANVVYFIVQPFTGWNTFNTSYAMQVGHQVYSDWARPLAEARRAALGLDAAEFALRFDALSGTLARSLVVAFVLYFALLFAALHRGSSLRPGSSSNSGSSVRPRLRWGGHVSLAAEFVSFLLVLIVIVLPFVLGVAWSVLPQSFLEATAHLGDLPGSLLSLALLGTWLSFALRRAYGESRFASAWRAAVVVVAFAPAILGYRLLLFVTTLAWL